MWQMLWPILVVVGANTLYNITTKSTPENVNSFASLSVTYLVATIGSALMFFLTSENKNMITEVARTNWTAYVLGIVVVALEFGYICIYRAGWKVSVASLVANISLACVLLVVGLLLYREALSLRQVIGMVLCACGLFLIVR